MPVWFDKTESYALDQTLFADAKVATTNPQASVIVDYWTGSKQRYSVSTATNTTVVQRTAYFPGWEVRVDGQKVPIQYERKDYNGLINFDLAPGTHAVEARFSEWTIARIVGDLFSLAGLLIMTYWVFLHAKGKRA
jgi:uncharacterized membrane protein YfhO